MKRLIHLLLALLAFAASIVFAMKIGGGAIDISWGDLFGVLTGNPTDPVHADVILQIRLPRIIMALFAGACLSCAGAVFQGLLRNPLADPYTLGVSGGATFGAVLSIAFATQLGFNPWVHGFPFVSVAALIGGLTAIFIIYLIGRSWNLFSTSTLILAGVTLNLVFASLILLTQYFADFTQVYEMIRWMMGGLDVIGYRDFVLLAPLSLLGFGIVISASRDLDLISVDPLTAATSGVRVTSVRWRLLITVSLMTGAVVALSGPIGFVGLIIPHAVRLVTGASHRRVVPLSIFAGGLFLLACDLTAQNILGDEELPVGVITSMLGGPFFLFLLLRRRGRQALWGD